MNLCHFGHLFPFRTYTRACTRAGIRPNTDHLAEVAKGGCVSVRTAVIRRTTQWCDAKLGRGGSIPSDLIAKDRLPSQIFSCASFGGGGYFLRKRDVAMNLQ